MNTLIRAFLFSSLVTFLADATPFDEIPNHANGTSPNKIQKTIVLKPDEKVLVNLFRTTYSDLLTDEYLNSEAFISGLLEADKWSLPDAAKHLKRILSWRAKNKIDDLNYEEPSVDLMKRFPWRVNATTYNGCPIVKILWNSWLISDYMQSQEFVRWGVKKLAPKCQYAMAIGDAKGFLMKNVAEPNALNAVFGMSLVINDKYTNLFEPVILINAPEDFHSLMKLLRPYLGLTARAFYLYSENETDRARKHFESYADISTLSLITWSQYSIKNA